MKTTYTLEFPTIPGLKTTNRSSDGWGEVIVGKYRNVIFASVYTSTKKNIKETARIMGWSIEKTKAEIVALDKRRVEYEN